MFELFIVIKSVRNLVWKLYNIFVEFYVPAKLRLIKMCLDETCVKIYVSKHLSNIFPVQSSTVLFKHRENDLETRKGWN
jgi:hypothetical protein